VYPVDRDNLAHKPDSTYLALTTPLTKLASLSTDMGRGGRLVPGEARDHESGPLGSITGSWTT